MLTYLLVHIITLRFSVSRIGEEGLSGIPKLNHSVVLLTTDLLIYESTPPLTEPLWETVVVSTASNALGKIDEKKSIACVTSFVLI